MSQKGEKTGWNAIDEKTKGLRSRPQEGGAAVPCPTHLQDLQVAVLFWFFLYNVAQNHVATLKRSQLYGRLVVERQTAGRALVWSQGGAASV